MGRGVAELSRQRRHSDNNMSNSNWREGEIRKLLIMGEKLMQSHRTTLRKDGAFYKKDAEELSSRGFCWGKKLVVSKIKNMLVCSLHSDVYSFLHASLLNHKKIKTFVAYKLF